VNTALPIPTENLIIKDVVEVSDTNKSSDKHLCSPVCVDRKPLFKVFGSFLGLPLEQCGNFPLIRDVEEPYYINYLVHCRDF